MRRTAPRKIAITYNIEGKMTRFKKNAGNRPHKAHPDAYNAAGREKAVAPVRIKIYRTAEDRSIGNIAYSGLYFSGICPIAICASFRKAGGTAPYSLAL